MSRVGRIIFATAVLSVPVTLFARAQLTGGIPLHHFQLSCDTCHTSDPAPGISNNEADAGIYSIKGDINKLCTSSGCHDFEPSLNHPVGIRPKAKIPEGMPLDMNSRITCLTCHDGSEPAGATQHPDRGQERFLTRPEGREFCGSCHRQMLGNVKQRSHWQFSTRAHLGSINTQLPDYETEGTGFDELDAESRTCLSCHDDVSAFIPPNYETRRQKAIRWADMSDHPIGMNYDNVVSRRPNDYKPLFDEGIRLFDGKLGCGSCHSLYAKDKNHPEQNINTAAFCRKCHNR